MHYAYQENISTEGITIITQHPVPDTVAQTAKILKANLIAAGLRDVEVEVCEQAPHRNGNMIFAYGITVGDYKGYMENMDVVNTSSGLPERLHDNFAMKLNGIQRYTHRILRYTVGKVCREAQNGNT